MSAELVYTKYKDMWVCGRPGSGISEGVGRTKEIARIDYEQEHDILSMPLEEYVKKHPVDASRM